jgi:gliding motility-associated-like protein
MKATLLFIFSMMGILAFSQVPTFDWAVTSGGSSSQINTSRVLTDASNNIFVAGSFDGTVDFDPGVAVYNVTSAGQQDGYVIKFDPLGNFIWVKTFGGVDFDWVSDMHLDSQNNILLVGNFKSTVDFDPGAGVASVTANGGYSDIFILKLTSSGIFTYVKTIGGTSQDEALAIEIDNLDNIYFTGKFVGNVDFDPSGIINNINSVTNGGIYVCKFNSSGNFVWAKNFRNQGISGTGTDGVYDSGLSICVDSNYNVHVVGEFAWNVDFDPGAGTYILASLANAGDPDINIFYAKLDINGSFISAHQLNGSEPFMVIDNLDNLYLSGNYIVSSTDFNPGAGNVSLAGPSSQFIRKTDANSNFMWVVATGSLTSISDNDRPLALDNLGNIYFTNIFTNTIDLDPSASVYNVTSLGASGNKNIFISKFNNSGNFIFGLTYGSALSNNRIRSFTIDNNSAIISSGTYAPSQLCDFDPSTSLYELTGGNNFVQKLSQCVATSFTISPTVCSTYTAPDGAIYTQSGLYFSTIPNFAGCDSIITLNLTILPAQTNSVSITQCDSYTSPLGNTYSSSGSFTETYTSVNGCDSLVTLNLTITDIQNTVNISACGNYLSPLGNNYNASGTYQETYTTSNGCDSTVTIQLTINNSITTNETKTACSSYLSPSGNTYTQSGQYYDTLLTSSGCDSIIITQLTILNQTTNIISPIVCSSFTSPSGITYNQTGTYIDTIQNVNGCDSIITINLSVVGTLNVNAGPDITICSGESITLNGAGATNYSWSNGVSNNIPFSPTVTTNYEVIGTDVNGCSGMDSVLITVNNPPTIAFNSILPDCEGGLSGSINVSVTGSSPFSYQWSNGSNTQNLLNVSAGNYGVTVTDANGCSSGANFDLQDGEGDCLIVPTGFSPNGDNENDNWNIIGIEQFAKNQVQVFNRWGQTVFESKGTAVNWNGSYNDKLLPIADYYFVVDLGNGQVFNGTLTIKY